MRIERGRRWVMLENDAPRPMIEERIRSEIEVRHWEALIRLRAMIEEDLEAVRGVLVAKWAAGIVSNIAEPHNGCQL